ncbi:MAG: enoyl-CoA hydratase/isomerase family protein [Myxococcota bacterium]
MTFVQVSHDQSISTITVARPDRMNALDAEVLQDLEEAVRQVEEHSETRCAILTGEGKAFVAGADIDAMRGMGPDAARDFARKGHAVFASLEALRIPVIAAVNGFALGGGCELALACDFIYASQTAKFGQPEVKLGIIPGFGGTQRLARRVGVALARELIYSGAMITAQEAHRIGIANRVLPSDQLLPEARSTAEAIAQMGPLAVASAKRIILKGEGLPLAEANPLEVDAFAELFGSDDQSEGMGAFLEKRSPVFRGE